MKMPRKCTMASKPTILQRKKSCASNLVNDSSKPPSLGLKIVSINSLHPSLSSEFDRGWNSEAKCTVCEIEFNDLSQYYAHKRDCLVGHLRCKSCPETFTSECDLNLHEKVHNDDKLWCKLCQVRFKTLQVAQDHEKQCHQADETSDHFVSEGSINDAVTVITNFPTETQLDAPFEDPLMIKCPMCPFQAGDLIGIKHHVQQCKHFIEDSSLVYSCSWCTFSNSNRSLIGDHFMQKLIYGTCPARNGIERCLIKATDRQKNQVRNKKRAMASHPGDSDGITIIHEEPPTVIVIPEENVRQPTTPSTSKPRTLVTKVKLIDHSTKGLVFTCHKCNKNYFTARSLEEHLKIDCCVTHYLPMYEQESLANQTLDTIGRSFSCHYCKRRLTSAKMVKDHGAVCPNTPSMHVSFIVCNDCGSLIKSLKEYEQHSKKCEVVILD